MSKVSSLDVANWFMNNKLDNPRNTLKGNIKLQKLLFFAQMISLAKYNELLFNEEFSAFDNGMVIEDLRLHYKNNPQSLLEIKPSFNEKQIDVLSLTSAIYGDAEANELSELSHQFLCWRKYLANSIDQDGYKDKAKSKVPYEELKKEIELIKDVLLAHEMLQNNDTSLDY